MKQSSSAEKLRDPFPRNEGVIGKKDRRIRVKDKQLSSFPFNNIGWIISTKKLSTITQSSLEAKGSGFLISECLVLTACHNFVFHN